MSEVVAIEEQTQARSGFYYGWVNLVVAAAAMVATLPGRTQGLGMITEPLLKDLHVTHLAYAGMNGWATLIGSSFCLACGPLIDRFGARTILTAVLVGLAATVLAMSRITGTGGLMATLILTRGFGQSALSVVSITIVGKWFVRRLPIAMGIYSILIGVGFLVGFSLVGYFAIHLGWRPVWASLAWATFALAALSWLLVRRSPESIGLTVDGIAEATGDPATQEQVGFTLFQGLKTSAFWAFALSAATFGLVSTGLMLFNEAVLTERGFRKELMLPVIGIIVIVGLAANFLGGWLAERWPIGRLMGCAMFFLAASLLLLHLAHVVAMVYAYAFAMGIASGIVTVIFFVCWARVFGREHLGAIQGAAQLLTVFGSAGGPIALQWSVQLTGSSSPLLLALAPVVIGLGTWCILLPMPVLDQRRFRNAVEDGA